MLERIKHMRSRTRSNLITYGIVIGFYAAVQLLSHLGLLSSAFLGQLVPICAYVMLAISLNLTVGFLGELSLGHAGFMSIGAFSGVSFWVATQGQIPVWLGVLCALIIGAVCAGIFGLLIGVPVLRLEGDYLAIVTLAFGQIIVNVINALYIGIDSRGIHISLRDAASLGLAEDGKVIINGAMGITNIPKASTFTLGIVLVVLTLAVILNLIHSRAGRAITAIRDNEIAAQSVGINLTKYKLLAFITSAVFAGLAGVLYALNFTSLVSRRFDYNTSITILMFVVLGGMGSIRGSIIAAAVLTVLPELMRSFGVESYRMLIYAIVLIAMMLFNSAPAAIAWRKKMTQKIGAAVAAHKKPAQSGSGKGAA